MTTVRLMLRHDIGRQCSIASTRWIRALREEDFAARPVVLLPPSDTGGKILAEQVSTVAARAKLITALSRRTRSAAVSLRDVAMESVASRLAPRSCCRFERDTAAGHNHVDVRWCVIAEPQVRRTAVMPVGAPR